ncbi:MAG: hypothetical protein QM689_05835 [Oscillospiraceae bacterium]
MKRLGMAVLIGFVFTVFAGAAQDFGSRNAQGLCFLFPSLNIAPAVELDDTQEDDGTLVIADEGEPEFRFGLFDFIKGIFSDS